MSEEQAIYKFKWSNYDLDRYVEARMEAANGLRRDAMVLNQRADQIDHEARELRTSLIEHEAAK